MCVHKYIICYREIRKRELKKLTHIIMDVGKFEIYSLSQQASIPIMSCNSMSEMIYWQNSFFFRKG